MRSQTLAALLCIALFSACAQEGMVGNTDIRLTIGTEFGPQDGQAAFEADRVDYRITCAGTAPGTLPIPPNGAGGDYVYDDSVDVSGAFEIVDANNPPVWQTIMNLPPGDCTISLSVFRNGQMACVGSDDFTVLSENTTQVDIALLCDLSIDIPDGTGDTDGEFQFEIGNECPKLFDFSAHPQLVPLGQLSTLVQTVAQDIDGTCGDNCDPQTCDFANPPNCTPGPDPGLTITYSALVGTFDDPNAAVTNYNCDPHFPGPIQICTTVSDGDLDCDKSRCFAVDCPDPCDGVICDDGNECTADHCDPVTETCVFEQAPDDIACSDCNGTCQAGVCDLGLPYTAAQNAPIMSFVGTFNFISNIYVNPYDGFFVQIPITYVFRNTSTYKGVGNNDTITGTPSGDFIFLSAPPLAAQTVCGVERFLAGSAGDFAHFADKFINLNAMEIQGQNAGDILWANSGDDFLQGGNGNDIMDGGPGNDFLLGDAGQDEITMGYDNGVDSVWGGPGSDRLSVNALASQITISPAGNAGYEFDIFYLGNWIAQIKEVEEFGAKDASIDLTACVAGVCNLCGDGVLNGGEECDDGNLANSDGCASNCTQE